MSDKQLQLEFEEQLAEIENASKSELANFNWYRNIGKLAESCYLLLTSRAFHMENWRRESSSHKTMIVITLEKMQPQASPEEAQLREFYNLTKAQARLVRQLASSIDVEEAANALNISVNTARSHLRAIYTRMGVSNKAQLLQQIGSTNSVRTRGSD